MYPLSRQRGLYCILTKNTWPLIFGKGRTVSLCLTQRTRLECEFVLASCSHIAHYRDNLQSLLCLTDTGSLRWEGPIVIFMYKMRKLLPERFDLKTCWKVCSCIRGQIFHPTNTVFHIPVRGPLSMSLSTKGATLFKLAKRNFERGYFYDTLENQA